MRIKSRHRIFGFNEQRNGDAVQDIGRQFVSD